MIYWHTTTQDNCKRILSGGFKDSAPRNRRYQELTGEGVWVSTQPCFDDDLLDAPGIFNFEAHTQAFLKIELSSLEGATQWHDETWTAGKQYLLPASVLNAEVVEEVSIKDALAYRLEHDPDAEMYRGFIQEAIDENRSYGRAFLAIATEVNERFLEVNEK